MKSKGPAWATFLIGTSASIAVHVFGSTGLCDALDHWHRRDASASNHITALTYDSLGKAFVAVDGAGPYEFFGPASTLVTSTNGATWNRFASGSTNLLTTGIARGNGAYMAAQYSQYGGGAGVMMRSEDGVRWVRDPLWQETNVRLVKNVGGRWAVAGWSYPAFFCDGIEGFPCPDPSVGIWFSNNRTSWWGAELSFPPFSGVGVWPRYWGGLECADVAYGSGLWIVLAWVFNDDPVAGAGSSTILQLHAWRSTDGTNFVRGARLAEARLGGGPLINMFEPLQCSIAHGDGRFVAVGYSQNIFTTTDGLQWATNLPPSPATLRDVAYGAGHFVAVGGRAIVTSNDGIHWRHRDSGVSDLLKQVEFGAHSFVAFGGTNVVMQSDPIVTLNLHRNADLHFALSAPQDRWCRIEFTDDLNSTVPWQALTNLVAIDDPFVWPAPAPAEQRRFYRAVLLP